MSMTCASERNSWMASKLVFGYLAISIISTWIGGYMDLLYFMMTGAFPTIDKIWYWMPGFFWLNIEWTILHQTAWALCWIVAIPVVGYWLWRNKL